VHLSAQLLGDRNRQIVSWPLLLLDMSGQMEPVRQQCSDCQLTLVWRKSSVSHRFHVVTSFIDPLGPTDNSIRAQKLLTMHGSDDLQQSHVLG
jgi:hypothetical protein